MTQRNILHQPLRYAAGWKGRWPPNGQLTRSTWFSNSAGNDGTRDCREEAGEPAPGATGRDTGLA